MRSKSIAGIVVTALVLLASVVLAQTSGSTSDYIFRYNAGLSKVMLDSMTFSKQQPLNLGQCTATEKINGPLACAVNCSNTPVCLLAFTGPSGLASTDLLEKVSEKPSVSTPAPSPTPFGSSLDRAPFYLGD